MPLTHEMQFLIHLDQFGDDDPAIAEINNRHSAEMDELVELAKNEGSIDKSLPTSWVVNLINGLFVVSWLQQQGGKYSAGQVAAFAYSTFHHGVLRWSNRLVHRS